MTISLQSKASCRSLSPGPQVCASLAFCRDDCRRRGGAALAGKPEPAAKPRYQTASVAPPPYYVGAPRPRDGADAWSDDSRSARSGRAFVNVGIFRDRVSAEQWRRDLGDLGPFEVAPLSGSNGADAYRVRLGPMSPSQAQVAASEIAGRGVQAPSIDFE
ncbi:MAG: SPOR domain-containing protein [Hyphomicrobium sp.]|nr:SPOR domain-containing protein [Hyphomicrobium sp.]